MTWTVSGFLAPAVEAPRKSSTACRNTADTPSRTIYSSLGKSLENPRLPKFHAEYEAELLVLGLVEVVVGVSGDVVALLDVRRAVEALENLERPSRARGLAQHRLVGRAVVDEAIANVGGLGVAGVVGRVRRGVRRRSGRRAGRVVISTVRRVVGGAGTGRVLL